MTRRHWHEPRPMGTEGLPMFAEPTAIDFGMAARDSTAAKHARDIERLVPLAQELAAKVGAHGITVSDLRIVAVQRSILTGQETGKQLSYLGKVMEAAGLEATGEFRRSTVVKTHGNLGAVWRVREGSTTRNDVPRSA